MYVLRVWYKDGTKRDFFFGSEEEKRKECELALKFFECGTRKLL